VTAFSKDLSEITVANSEQLLSDVPPLTEKERHQLLVEWNDTKVNYPKDVCIHQLFEAQVDRTPDAVAVVFEDEQLTYQELNQQANQLAYHLKSLGVGPGMFVAVCMNRSLEMIPTLLGILKAGGAYVPLEPSFPKARFQWILSSLKISCIITQTAPLKTIHDLLPQLPALEHVICLDTPQQPESINREEIEELSAHQQIWMRSYLAQLPKQNLPTQASQDDPAYIIFTSGSTGTPKGVMVRHKPVINLIDWVNRTFDVNSSDRILFITSLCFDLSVYDVFGLLAAGGSIRVVSDGNVRDPERLLCMLGDEPITFWDSAPAVLQQLVPFFPFMKSTEKKSQLRLVFLSGDWIPLKLPDLVRKTFPGVEVIGLGGATEATVWSNYYHIGDVDPHWVSIPYGKPIQNAQYYILDSHLHPCPIGVPGDLYIGGDCLSSGYVNEPILTAERFIPNSFSNEPDTRLYKTGDLARYLPDGNIEFLGRIDHQVKIRGFRIEIGEIEAVLSQHPAVRETVVLAQEDIPGNKRLVAYVVVNQKSAHTINELRRFLQEQLPEYMVPSAFVQLEALPLTPNGKVDRRALPMPDTVRPELAGTYVAPRTPVEEVLAKIWAEVLRLEQVGIHDNFFELGGDSILSIQIIAKAHQAGLQLTPTQMFQHPTLAELAVVVGTTTAVQAEQGLVTGHVLLTPIQQWFFEQELPEPHHWNWDQAILLEVRQALDFSLLEQVVQHLLVHHDALRLRFERSVFGWQQVNALPDEAISCLRIDLSALPEAEQGAAIQKATAELQVSLNLSEGPLVRVALFDLGTEKPGRLLLVVHHLVVDGVSWRILLADLQMVYQQLSLGEAIQLPPKTTSFKDWAERLTAYAQSEALTEELDYWLTEARSKVAPLPVDYQRDRDANTVASATNVTVSLSVEQTRALLQEIPRTYNTQINDVLLTALVLAFSQWTDARLLLIDMEGHGREEVVEGVDLSRTVGWFTTIFPLLLDLGEADNLGEALKSIKEQLRRIPSRGIGYGLLRYLRDTEIVNKLRSLPQSAVLFNYLGQFDQVLPQSSNFGLARESIGYTRNPQGIRRHQMEVTGFVVEGQLQLNWTYSVNFYRRETIESLAQRFIEAIQSLISHCQSSEVESYIPSTFPAVRQGQVDFPLPIVVPTPEQRHLPFPLTDIQQAYWVGQSRAFELGNVRAHVYVEFESVGLDLERCNLALQRLIERHEMLRIVVLPDGQQQILEQVPTYEIEVLDQRGKDPQVVASQLESVRQRMSHQGPANDRWPLFEVLAHCLEDQRVRLHISISLLVMDGRAALILTQEFLQLYQNLDACLAPMNLSFRDYVLALDTLQDSEVYQRSLNYWKNRLSTLPPAPELPLAKNLASVSNPRFVRRSARLEPQTWRRLKSRAAQAGLTPTVALCTAYAEALTAWSKTPDFTVNILFFNRLPLHPQVNDIVGNFSSTILLEVNNTAELPFDTRAKRLQEQLWTELEHSHVSGVRVLRERNRVEGRTSRATMPVVFASTLNLNSQGEETSSIPLPGKVVYSCLQTPQVLLDHQVYEQDGTLLFNWDAVEELFPEGLLDDMFSAYCRLLHRLANEDDAWQKTVPQLIPIAQLQQRTIINATEAPVPAAMLHTLFAAQVPQRSRQAAVISSNQTLTYEELYCRSNQVAHRLRQLGARPNVLVAVVMEKGWEQVVAVLGVLLSGAAYLAIDPALPKERLWYLLDQSKVGLVLTQSWIDKNLEWPETVHRLCVDSEDLDKVDDQPLDLVQRPEDLAYVIFTSGSTGLPKGVMINHRSAVNTICDINQRFGIGPEDRLLALSSLSFDLSVYDIFGTLAAGGTIIIPDASAVRDPVHWADLLVREKVTIWNSVPALMQMLVEYAADRPDMPPCPLRLVLLSGDWIPVVLPDQIKALFEGVQVISLGGATEASIWSILYPIEDVDPAWKSIPYGKPMLNQRCYVLNKALEPCPVWVIGGLYIGGVGLAKGYWQDEEKTNARFIEHPRTGERLYCTGDLGRYLPDGNIEFLGREDFQVKVQGYRIELGEIEAALLQHPAVRDAVATAVGERNDNKRLAAYVIVDQDGVLDINELRSLLAKKLPDYMVPSAFVLLDALPLTPNGKVDRKALPVPDLAIPEREKAFVVPHDPLELQLAQIWGDLLNTDSIGITDNFFDLGGHSLLAVRLMTKIQKMFEQELLLSTLLQGPTIEHLASVLRQQAGSVPESSLVKIQPAGSKPPFFCIHPVGGNVLCYVDLARHLGLEQPFYALQSPGLDGKREPYTQIEDMAAHYIEALRAIQPEGPYFLGGWSMGGIVAFEMAQQLHKQEQEVGSLVLLDSRAPVGTPNLDDATLLSWFIRDLGGQFAKNLAVSHDELRRLGPDKGLHHILEQARKANVLPPDVGLMQVQRLLQVFKANTRAIWSYMPEAYPNRVILLRSSEVFSPDFEDFGDPTWGWGEFASKQIEIYTVPGNHYTILTNPHVKFLAERLKHCLNQVIPI
jgi:amino acid adenylation domain-containing protein/non-ribosomal peptide synthase protein (TIGR01720 family)